MFIPDTLRSCMVEPDVSTYLQAPSVGQGLFSTLPSNVAMIIFTQRSPPSGYVNLINELRKARYTDDQINTYMSENARTLKSLDDRRWLIHGLGSVNSRGELLLECRGPDGEILNYNTMVPNNDIMEQLKTKWPTTYTEISNEQFWKASYGTSGTCMYSTPTLYFEHALNLLRSNNMRDILSRAKVIPGKAYKYNRMMELIRNFLKAKPFIACQPSQNDRIPQQFILEIHLCFHRGDIIVNCNFPDRSNDCDENGEVISPRWSDIK